MAAPTPAVLLLNLPPTAIAGIDLVSFTTNPRFQGIKNLPSGFHFIFVGATNDLSLRHGCWINIRSPESSGPPDLLILKWDPQHEHLIEEVNQAEILRYRANLRSLWREGLTPYRQNASEGEVQHERGDWMKLTSHISSTILTRICGKELHENHWSLNSASSAKRDMDDIPGLTRDENILAAEKELGFLPVDLKQTWREGATGRERTEAARDRSWALGDLVEKACGGDDKDVLGEMQFCFLMVLTLNNYSCLEQWKRILQLLLTSSKAVMQRGQFYVDVIRTLKLQLQHSEDVEGGLFDLSDEGAGFLKQLLIKFRRGLVSLSGTAKADVMDELDELEAFLKDQHGWQLDDNYLKRGMFELEDGEQVEVELPGNDEQDETGEYAPTMVDLSPEQMRMLGLQPGPVKETHLTLRQKAEEQLSEEEEEEQDLEDMDSRY